MLTLKDFERGSEPEPEADCAPAGVTPDLACGHVDQCPAWRAGRAKIVFELASVGADVGLALPIDDYFGAVAVISDRVDASRERAWAWSIRDQRVDRPRGDQSSPQRRDVGQLQRALSDGRDLVGVRERAAFSRIENQFGEQFAGAGTLL